MKQEDLIQKYRQGEQVSVITEALATDGPARLHLKGLVGSMRSLVTAAVYEDVPGTHLIVLPDKEAAAYFYNDLEALFSEKGSTYERKQVLFFPSSYKRHFEPGKQDNTQLLSRAEVINRLASSRRKTIIVSYSEALAEKVITRKSLAGNVIRFRKGDKLSLDSLVDRLYQMGFDRNDFVFEPGQFSIRGGIVDVYSFANDHPYRLEFAGNEIDSVRTFDPATQLSVSILHQASILSNIQDRVTVDVQTSFFSFLSERAMIWIDNAGFSMDRIEEEYNRADGLYREAKAEEAVAPSALFITADEFREGLEPFRIIEFGRQFHYDPDAVAVFKAKPQPSFNKNFDILIKNLEENSKAGILNLIFSDNPKQIERIYAIFDDIRESVDKPHAFDFSTMNISLHEGFVDQELDLACYTDHQIFERYHKFHLKDKYTASEAITLKELYNLNPGDYVTHIDHGVGRFDGLEKIENNGRLQEAIRLVYSNSDLLYVSIHSLHRIAKYVGKDGTPPKLDKLGGNAWNRLKNRTKSRVKDIAKDLIKLYAERKAAKGHRFNPDTYLQTELEASFIYEDTPDQVKASKDVKADMEKGYPMDRLICGDVGFGKTEVAVRAAFKAVADSKQVAVLVPTTILALQHYKTFSERLKDFPAHVSYISRFRSQKQQKETLEKLKNGKVDILIGTHRLLGKDIDFKDLGLLIIDEEQKFGVAAKEKLKKLRVNVDTLTLTATPIPRTLQFSMMGARDLSIINTPPPNRYPVQTEIKSFNQEFIREAIMYEISRGGQVFFVHNRVQNIHDVEDMIRKFAPEVTIAVAHGQMEGRKLENIMVDFIEGEYDVLLATTIIESGLDIPNVNTIIINDAQNYGLSDLHQLRGRVGRSNRKAFCYLLAPPLSVLTPEARKRLKAIEEFSDLGSGFNIAMRDLDIRGAGNILGAEQSGFIADIGFEMYQKILDEAMRELKEGEFKGLFKEEKPESFVSDCQIESDLEILIPDDYVTNISERLVLYRELDSIEEEEELQRFRMKLTDRFGPVPTQTDELMDTIRMRWMARKIGFEKLILKNNRLIGYFPASQESPYYQSSYFTRVLEYVQANPRTCHMQERNNKLSLRFRDVPSINRAINVLRPLHDKVVGLTAN